MWVLQPVISQVALASERYPWVRQSTIHNPVSFLVRPQMPPDCHLGGAKVGALLPQWVHCDEPHTTTTVAYTSATCGQDLPF